MKRTAITKPNKPIFFFPQKSLQSVEKTKSQYSCDENFQHSFFLLAIYSFKHSKIFLISPKVRLYLQTWGSITEQNKIVPQSNLTENTANY